MTALVYLAGHPGGTFPDSVSNVYLWAIKDSSEVWSTSLLLNGVYPDGTHEYVAGGGPLWDPGITVDVVIGMRTPPNKVSLVLRPQIVITRSATEF